MPNNVHTHSDNPAFMPTHYPIPPLRRKHALSIRIWHWTSFVGVTLALLTVCLAKTMFSSKTYAPLIQGKLQQSGISLTDDQAKSVAKLYSHAIWDWHVYIGYGLTILLAYRIILEFFQLKDQKIIGITKAAIVYLRGNNNKETQHYLLKQVMYWVYYLVITLMILTGLFIEFSSEYPDLKPIRKVIKNIHGIGMYIIIAFVLLHIAGVLRAEFNKKSKGLISAMINGGE